MERQMLISDAIEEKEVRQNKEDDTPTTDVSIELGPENTSDKEVAVKDDTEKCQQLAIKLERFLKRACDAEEKKNDVRAARAFVLALYCEGKLRPDVENPCSYVRQALPVY